MGVLRAILAVLILLLTVPVVSSAQATPAETNSTVELAELPYDRPDQCVRLEHQFSQLQMALIFCLGVLSPGAYRFGRDRLGEEGSD